MRNTITIIAILLSSIVFGQGKINIFNFSVYGLYNTLVGSNANANCFPSVSGANYSIPVPSGGSVTYNGYYQSGFQSPPISQWTIYTAGGGISNPLHSSPILNTPVFAMYTTWQMNKFFVVDTNGNSVPFGGNSIGVINCNTPIIDYIGPTPGNPVPYEAFWFTAGGETYFIVQ